MTSKQALKNIKSDSECVYVDERFEEEILFAHDYFHQEINVIEKDLEVLEILKKKLVELNRVKTYTDYRVYNCYQYSPDLYLTEKEFNKIKEWLENEK